MRRLRGNTRVASLPSADEAEKKPDPPLSSLDCFLVTPFEDKGGLSWGPNVAPGLNCHQKALGASGSLRIRKGMGPKRRTSSISGGLGDRHLDFLSSTEIASSTLASASLHESKLNTGTRNFRTVAQRYDVSDGDPALISDSSANKSYYIAQVLGVLDWHTRSTKSTKHYSGVCTYQERKQCGEADVEAVRGDPISATKPKQASCLLMNISRSSTEPHLVDKIGNAELTSKSTGYTIQSSKLAQEEGNAQAYDLLESEEQT